MILPGVRLVEGGAEVGVVSAHATAVELCLFEGDTERRVTLRERTGDLWHGFMPGMGVGARYGFRVHGPWAPLEGHRFNPAKLLLDPYALAIDRPFRLDQAMFGHRDAAALLADDGDSAFAMPKAIVAAPVAGTPAQLTPWSRSVIYELHVRGFTMLHPEVPPEIRGTFAGLAHPAAIGHLVRLGVTAVELLPAAAWIEERHLAALGLQNYWGYNSVGFLAPDPRLAPGGWAEVRACVAALAAAGIETILDVVLNHTGEGDDWGPTLSFRGLDNASYYRLRDGAYVNDTGCGNTLALDRPPMLDLAMESLRAWARFGGVHGFRFDLAATLGRGQGGFEPHAPLLTAISQDPLLRTLKLIAEPWDIGPGGYQLGRFPAAWGEWNDRFRDDVRAFWQGTGGLGQLATRLAGSADVFAARHRPRHSVNFVTAHDGFTLADLVSYAQKHNEANGEGNRDGTGNNLSWNNGVEGASVYPTVLAARQRDQRALLATLLLARGTPMLAMGSELGHSQGGNNNAYAQDNRIAWLDWSRTDAALCDFAATLIAARRDLGALRCDRFLDGAPGETTLPDAAWFRLDGAPMQTSDWSSDALALVLTTAESRVCIAINRGLAQDFTPPSPQDGRIWRVIADSAGDGPGLSARSVRLLAEMPAPPAHRAESADADTLVRLARATGIAADWWEVDGTHHQVSPDTVRALLTGMGLDITSAGAARDALSEVAILRERRAMPAGLVVRRGETAVLALPLPEGHGRRRFGLDITCADGTRLRHVVGAEEGAVEQRTGLDGRKRTVWHVPLPDLPIGRHRIAREDRPEQLCTLTVAPVACYLPSAFAAGQRRFGLAAQLYSLRRAGDQGIGDFTTLSVLAKAAAEKGAAALGLNPLHALFPGDRSRASPYHPSDRRFLDPISLDLATLEDGLPLPDQAFPSPAGRDVDHPRVWAHKQAVLQARFAAFSRTRAGQGASQDFADFVADSGTALQEFVTFQVIAEQQDGPWQSWPVGLQNPAGDEVANVAAAHPDRVAYHQYLQWQCDRQLARAASAGLEIGLIRDLAVGSAPDGAEAWSQASMLARGVSIGAPPDPFSAEGQVWSLPPPNPLALARYGTRGFAALLEANLRHAGGLRIDHVMGLARLFWVPEGARGRDGAYVAQPLADLLGEVALASLNAKAMIVGEDLGTVPDGLREAMRERDILSYRVLFLERDGAGFKPQTAYPHRAMACVSTHDLPTLAGWVKGADIAEQAQLGMLLPEQMKLAERERVRERALLQDRLDGADVTDPATLAVAAHDFIGRSGSELVLAQLDDLVLEPDAVNLPGTDKERPNWRRRLGPPVPELLEGDVARAVMEGFAAAGRRKKALLF